MKKMNYKKLVRNTIGVFSKRFLNEVKKPGIAGISILTGMTYGLKYKEDFGSGVKTVIVLGAIFGTFAASVEVKKNWDGIKIDSLDYNYGHNMKEK
jgi:hypothetical protein